MSEAVDSRVWWSKALMIGAIVGIVAMPLGALGTKFGIWPFTTGFLFLGIGVILAAIVFFLGIIGAVYTTKKGMRQDRSSILIGIAISVVILGLMANQFVTAGAVPPIHNISTDTDDPPQFATLVAVREAEGANPLAYNAAELADLQRGAYPFVEPYISAEAADVTLNRVVGVLEGLGMDVANVDRDQGLVEATDETFWFGFKDDVAVRVRAANGGSIVDIRSVSRVGQSDLGKNAERIAAILNGLSN